jgi:hypothetical protein
VKVDLDKYLERLVGLAEVVAEHGDYETKDPNTGQPVRNIMHQAGVLSQTVTAICAVLREKREGCHCKSDEYFHCGDNKPRGRS